MNPTAYARFDIRDAGCAEVARIYSEWVVGLGDFDDRQKKLALGVPDGLTVDQIIDGGDFGSDACRVRARRDDRQDAWFLHWTHGDQQAEDLEWHTMVRVQGRPAGVLVQSLTGRVHRKGALLPPMAGASRTTKVLVKRFSGRIEPRYIRHEGAPPTINADDADGWIRYILLADDRTVPVVVVAPDEMSGRPVLDPRRLAVNLTGAAATFVLRDTHAANALSKAMRTLGLSSSLDVFDGGIRLYRPHVRANPEPDVHPVLKPWNVARYGREGRETTAAGVLLRHITRALDPKEWMSVIAEIDLANWRHRTVPPPALPAPPPPGADHEVVQLREAVVARDLSIDALRQDLVASQALVDEAAKAIAKSVERANVAENQLIDVSEKLEETERDRDLARDRAKELAGQLDESKESEARDINATLRDALRRSFGDESLTPEDCLTIVSALHGENMRLLPTAWSSARRSASFQDGRKLRDLLLRLVTTYRDGLIEGGDVAAKGVFGANEYAAKESDSRMGDSAIKARTFRYDDDDVVMVRHIKIGVKDSIDETIRVHFHWDAERRLIVVGHCGEHLKFSR